MILNVQISSETEAALRRRAEITGQDIVTVATQLLEKELASRSLEEISGGLQKRFEESGMTEEELGDMLERAKHEMRAERRSRENK